MVNKKITVIGLGLIGGSIVKALRERMNITNISAVDNDIDSLNLVLKEGFITKGFSKPNEYIFDSDIIFICTPVEITISYIDILKNNVKNDCIITDTSSTKGNIINYINSLDNPPCFIGGHPMAGSEKMGFKASYAHLFENAYYILSHTKNSSSNNMDILYKVVKGLGAIPLILDAQTHDTITATISHVPHIVASALVNLVKSSDSENKKMQTLAAGGFKDITRIASSSPQMWENIVSSNTEKIRKTIFDFIETLQCFVEYIDNSDSESIYNFFESAKLYRDSFSDNQRGLIEPSNELVVDVIDKPGIIGDIATLLGQNGVNIKNINVSNSREFEQGCLRITLPDLNSVNISFDLLTSNGYKVFKI